VNANPHQTPALEVRGLSRSFGPVRALRDVNLVLDKGEVMGLLGDNGAGKSTLVRCLSGMLQPDEGAILIDGREVEIANPKKARELGIETVYQDLALVSTLDVSSNLFLNREVLRPNRFLRSIGWLNDKHMRHESSEILARLGIKVSSVRTSISHLSGGQRQAIAVGRAVGWGKHIVLMDEPAAALGVEQSRQVLELVRALKGEGVSLLFISHNMQQVMEVCDRALVLRHGQKVGDVALSDVTPRDLVDLITGAVADVSDTVSQAQGKSDV
jgi:ABC-type sugar transport system ATPase subunit